MGFIVNSMGPAPLRLTSAPVMADKIFHENGLHSIISSARASSVEGIIRPRVARRTVMAAEPVLATFAVACATSTHHRLC
jgi:hypothetical protein